MAELSEQGSNGGQGTSPPSENVSMGHSWIAMRSSDLEGMEDQFCVLWLSLVQVVYTGAVQQNLMERFCISSIQYGSHKHLWPLGF